MEGKQPNNISPIVIILLTIILCAVGLSIFLLNHEILASFDPEETEQAYQQSTVVHTAMVIQEMLRLPERKVDEPETVEELIEPTEEQEEEQEQEEQEESSEEQEEASEPPEPGELFATVESDSIAYNWKARVNIHSQGVVNNPGAYNGMTREFGVNKYKTFKFSKGSNQRAIHDKIAAATVNQGGYAMYNGSLLMVAPLSLSGAGNWVGCKGSLTDSNGKSMSVIFVDAKGNLVGDDVVVNENETIGKDLVKGHFLGGKIDVIEIEADKGTNKATFKAQFGLDLSTSSPAKGYTKGASLL